MNPDEYYQTATKRNIGIVSRAEQERLRRSRVAIVGMGGGGGIYLSTLVRMGIGHFHVADFDSFSVANVNRQFGATSSTVGLPKTQVMADLVRSIHPSVDIKEFEEGLNEHNVAVFLRDVDVVVDAIDVFAQPARFLLYREARRLAIPVLFGAPLGLSATLCGFAREGMSFEDYFDIREGMKPFDIMIRFMVGVAPKGRHWTYMDSSHVAPEDQTGPSSAAAVSLLAGVVCTEVLVALLQRRALVVAPHFSQFDPYLGRYWRGKLRWGNRGPLQRLKLWLAGRKFSAFAENFNQVGFEPLPTRSTEVPTSTQTRVAPIVATGA